MPTTISRPIARTTSLRSEAAFDALWDVMNMEDERSNAFSSQPFSTDASFNMLLKRHLRCADRTFTTAHWDLLVRLASDAVQPNQAGDVHISTESIAANKYGAAIMFIAMVLLQTYGEAFAYRKTTWMSCKSEQRDVVQDTVLSCITRESGSETLQSTIIRKRLQAPQVMLAIQLNIQAILYRRFNAQRLNVDPSVEILSDTPSDTRSGHYFVPETAQESENFIQLEFLKEFMQRAYDDMTEAERQVMRIWMTPDVQDKLVGFRTFKSQLNHIRDLTGLTKYRTDRLADAIVERFRTLLNIQNFVKVERDDKSANHKHLAQRSNVVFNPTQTLR